MNSISIDTKTAAKLYLTEYQCDGSTFVGPKICAKSFEDALQKAGDSNLRIVGEIVAEIEM
jgi:hypothetical protein